MTCKGGSILGPDPVAMAGHRGQVQQERIPGGTLDQRTDRGTVQTDDQVPFPMARYGTISRLGGTLADQDFRGNKALTALPGSGARHPQRPPRSQARR
ncbi:hypothetical protein B1A_02746 [mine drainage metagenome]|uniref:Uncharacterized protein n=1 Tax=mine drainage metagenome TaxID=410659 RepID=T1D8M4_9ZZZZ